jgi:hypothetical protein
LSAAGVACIGLAWSYLVLAIALRLRRAEQFDASAFVEQMTNPPATRRLQVAISRIAEFRNGLQRLNHRAAELRQLLSVDLPRASFGDASRDQQESS